MRAGADMKRVLAGREYRYDPVLMDQIQPPIGVQQGSLRAGQVVRVVALPGCPKPGVMGMCHIQAAYNNGRNERGESSYEFLGLVQVTSLRSLNERSTCKECGQPGNRALGAVRIHGFHIKCYKEMQHEPIPAACARCGSPGFIQPTNVFVCPKCNPVAVQA